MSPTWTLGCVLACLTIASAIPQDIKFVKGGHSYGGFQHNSTASLIKRFHENGTIQEHNTTVYELPKKDVGVCYIEVQTALLTKDPAHIPAGNGSRPDLSRIRSCCKGYVRNIHNFYLCDPVCTAECVNSLCTAPEVCTCYPDHVRNKAGFCMPTCPVGCQHGSCDKNRCICNAGYVLDISTQFCVPFCEDNCGGIGDCTAPNTCECKQGYKSSATGSCQASCDNCINGDCIAPNICVCKQGYQRNETSGGCIPVCDRGCGFNGKCIGPNVCSNEREREPVTNPNFHDLPSVTNPGFTVHPLNHVVETHIQECKPGYFSDRTHPDGIRCIPHCPGGCANGFCAAPSVCVCSPGYEKDFSVKGRQACLRRTKRFADLYQSINLKRPLNVAELLTYEIPDY